MARGYINNVHPETQGGLHNALSGLLGRFMPLFSKALLDLAFFDRTQRVLGDQQSELDQSTRPVDPRTQKPVEQYDEETYEENPLYEDWLDTSPYIDPLPGPYDARSSLTERTLGTGYSLAGRTVQVIVKVAEMWVACRRFR